MEAITGGALLAKLLKNAGVKYVFIAQCFYRELQSEIP